METPTNKNKLNFETPKINIIKDKDESSLIQKDESDKKRKNADKNTLLSPDRINNPTKNISKNPTKNISKNPTKNISKNPTKNISKNPTKDITKTVSLNVSGRDKPTKLDPKDVYKLSERVQNLNETVMSYVKIKEDKNNEKTSRQPSNTSLAYSKKPSNINTSSRRDKEHKKPERSEKEKRAASLEIINRADSKSKNNNK